MILNHTYYLFSQLPQLCEQLPVYFENYNGGNQGMA